MIKKLEEDLEQMESLTTLIANDTAITRVPSAVGRLKNFGYISLCGYKELSRDVVPYIIRSWIGIIYCSLYVTLFFMGMGGVIYLFCSSCNAYN